MIREGDYSLLLRRSDAAGQTPDRPFELQNFDESEANLVPFCIHTGDYKLRSSQTFVSERFGFHRSQLLQLRFERFCHQIDLRYQLHTRGSQVFAQVLLPQNIVRSAVSWGERHSLRLKYCGIVLAKARDSVRSEKFKHILMIFNFLISKSCQLLHRFSFSVNYRDFLSVIALLVSVDIHALGLIHSPSNDSESSAVYSSLGILGFLIEESC